jgi:hypothetical protein
VNIKQRERREVLGETRRRDRLQRAPRLQHDLRGREREVAHGFRVEPIHVGGVDFHADPQLRERVVPQRDQVERALRVRDRGAERRGEQRGR